MKTKKVTVAIPENDYATLEAISKASGMSMNDVLVQCVRSGMPPSLAKVPAEFHDELIVLNEKGDLDLLAIVENSAPAIKMSDSQKKADFDLLRRTYALRLLRWRGHSIPENMIG